MPTTHNTRDKALNKRLRPNTLAMSRLEAQWSAEYQFPFTPKDRDERNDANR